MKRSHRISVPDSWLEKVNDYKANGNLSIRALGDQLASAIERERPFSVAAVHDYLHGKLVTEEMTEAFATLMGVPAPVFGANDPRVERWCELGARLLVEAPGRFERELEALSKLVEALEEHSGRGR